MASRSGIGNALDLRGATSCSPSTAPRSLDPPGRRRLRPAARPHVRPGAVTYRCHTPQEMTPRRLANLLLAALTALAIIAPTATASGAQNRVRAFSPGVLTHTQGSATERPRTRPGSVEAKYSYGHPNASTPNASERALTRSGWAGLGVVVRARSSRFRLRPCRKGCQGSRRQDRENHRSASRTDATRLDPREVDAQVLREDAKRAGARRGKSTEERTFKDALEEALKSIGEQL